MQTDGDPPTSCPNCGSTVLRELLTGEPLEPSPTVTSYGETLYRSCLASSAE